MAERTISVEIAHGTARVRLARPNVRNAFNAEMIAELREIFSGLCHDDDVRAIVLSGEGKVFCGGADINWMSASLELTKKQNIADATAMSEMFRAIDRCPKPIIARIHGAALGGGAGLAAVCDVAIASEETTFGFTEVKLGILPAVISPFIISKIGISHARALFFTGERFDAHRAKTIGLVHEVVPFDDLDASVDRKLLELHGAAPTAIAAAKKLIAEVSESDYDDTRGLTARAIAKQRTSEEGQEGLRAFLEHRAAKWAE